MSLLLLVLIAGLASPAPLHEESFVLSEAAEVVAEIEAGCSPCDWGTAGQEAAVLELKVDGRYSQHLFLTRGEAASYRVALGRLEAGPHRLSVVHDHRRSARRAGPPRIASMRLVPAEAQTPDALVLAYAPTLWARPNTMGRFTDVPLLMWVESDRLDDGRTRLRYSVVFSNEDGGTPPDRLMATWGRLTDLEYVYGVELDDQGRVLAEQYQGPKHRLRPFAGAHHGTHPVLHVVTDNNMVSDRGQETMRFAPAPIRFDLTATSREAVMDAEHWTYAVSVREARREGRIDETARPGSKRLPDPRRFATLEACAETEDATLTFALAVRGADGTTRWFESDGGQSTFRIGRRATEFPNGCFRGAVALPGGTGAADVLAVRFRAFTRIAGKDEPRLPPGTGRAILTHINRLFLLDAYDQPGPSLYSWRGSQSLAPEGRPAEIVIRQ